MTRIFVDKAASIIFDGDREMGGIDVPAEDYFRRVSMFYGVMDGLFDSKKKVVFNGIGGRREGRRMVGQTRTDGGHGSTDGWASRRAGGQTSGRREGRKWGWVTKPVIISNYYYYYYYYFYYY